MFLATIAEQEKTTSQKESCGFILVGAIRKRCLVAFESNKIQFLGRYGFLVFKFERIHKFASQNLSKQSSHCLQSFRDTSTFHLCLLLVLKYINFVSFSAVNQTRCFLLLIRRFLYYLFRFFVVAGTQYWKLYFFVCLLVLAFLFCFKSSSC